MHSKDLTLQVKLMASEAADRLEDAAMLDAAPDCISDSPYLLTLLAFEILLKATVRIHGRAVRKKHNYRELFTSLPGDVQTRLLAAAATRMNSADYSKLDDLLDIWSRNFVDLRYPYAKYEGLTEEEYLARGAAWMLKGAPEAEADFRYKHEELNGLTEALQQEVAGWLKDHS